MSKAKKAVDSLQKLGQLLGGGARQAWSQLDTFGDASQIIHTSPDGTKTVMQQTLPTGKTVFYPESNLYRQHDTLESAINDIKGTRISGTLKQRNAEKYGRIPNTWKGEERAIAKRLIDEGFDIGEFAVSSQSNSRYITLGDGRKIRLSDHDLPPKYEGADINYRFGSDRESLIARLKSGDESGSATPAALVATAVGTGSGMAIAPEFAQAYNDYIRDEMEAKTAADTFLQMRGQKSGFWEARRQDLLDMVDSIGGFAENVAFPAIDKPLQGYLALAGVGGALAQGQGFDQSIAQGAQIARQPSEQTTYNMGGAVTDAVSPYVSPEAAALAGALTHTGIQMGSPF